MAHLLRFIKKKNHFFASKKNHYFSAMNLKKRMRDEAEDWMNGLGFHHIMSQSSAKYLATESPFADHMRAFRHVLEDIEAGWLASPFWHLKL